MNILESILISHRLFQFWNLTQLQLEKITWSTVKSRFLEIYSYIVLLISIVILIQDVFIPISQRPSSGDVGVTVDFIQLFGIRIAHIVSVLETLCHRKEQQNLIKIIQEIDRKFEISLNIDVENRKLRSQIFKNGLAMLVLYTVCECFILIFTALGMNFDFFLFWLLYAVPLFACGIRYFQYLLFICIIKKRFKKLTEVLGSVNLLCPNRSEKQKFSGKIPSTVKLIKSMDKFNKTLYRDGFDLTNLLVIRDLYNRLWEVSILVNKCFGLSILIAIGVDFLAITSNLYWIFLNFKKYSTSYSDFFRLVPSLFWSCPHVFNIMTLAIICHKTVEITSQIVLGVHKVQIDLFNDNHNSLIEQFSLQLLHQKIQFTAFGFFTIDCSLLYTIVGATTTYLIILIQFHMSEQKEVSAQHAQTVVVNVTK